jgi:PRTRC genetic system protein C
MLQASPLTTSFAYLSLKLPDSDSKLTVEEVRSFYSTQYPDLVTPSITGPEVLGDKVVYSFTRHIGTKG